MRDELNVPLIITSIASNSIKYNTHITNNKIKVFKVKSIGIEIANSIFNVVQQAYIHTLNTKLVLSIIFFTNPSQRLQCP
jgi:hypothetical protein